MLVSIEQYISSISDIERIALIEKIGNEMYLCADVENGGDYLQPRIEEMYFLLNQSLGFLEAINECRNRYCGGISFIEYSESNDVSDKAINDFLQLGNGEKTYVVCKDSDFFESTANLSDGMICVNII